MTDQEIIDMAVAEIRKLQDDVNRKAAEREAKAARFRTLVNEVRKQTGCENITAERHIEEIMIHDEVHKSQPQTPTSGTCEGCNRPSSTILCQDCFNTGDFQ